MERYNNLELYSVVLLSKCGIVVPSYCFCPVLCACLCACLSTCLYIESCVSTSDPLSVRVCLSCLPAFLWTENIPLNSVRYPVSMCICWLEFLTFTVMLCPCSGPQTYRLQIYGKLVDVVCFTWSQMWSVESPISPPQLCQ